MHKRYIVQNSSLKYVLSSHASNKRVKSFPKSKAGMSKSSQDNVMSSFRQ